MKDLEKLRDELLSMIPECRQHWQTQETVRNDIVNIIKSFFAMKIEKEKK